MFDLQTPLHVVIVEDDLNSADILGSLLTQMDISFTTSRNGGEVLNILRALPKVDVLFLDLELPDLNGYEVLRSLRQEAAFANLTVVAYTSHTNEMAAARAAGFQSFLSKPLNGEDTKNHLWCIFNSESVWE